MNTQTLPNTREAVARLNELCLGTAVAARWGESSAYLSCERHDVETALLAYGELVEAVASAADQLDAAANALNDRRAYESAEDCEIHARVARSLLLRLNGDVGVSPESPVSPKSECTPSTSVEIDREDAAAIVHEAMRWAVQCAPDKNPPFWVDGGNSFVQDRARRAVAAIFDLSSAELTAQGVVPGRPNPSPKSECEGGSPVEGRDTTRLDASDLTDDELRAEQGRVEKLWDSMFESDEDGEVFEGRGGSPGEWMQERMDEIATEQARRSLPTGESQ